MVEAAGGPGPFRHAVAGGVGRPQARLESQPLDLSAEQQRAVVPGFVERELDARRTGIEDGDAAWLWSWACQATMLVPPST